ncbi:MAG: efflux RND transporter periplasmic adaptor subunit [Xanthomonadales bacterium]|jgi:RND family efflux transporter MFP subunit|nr:efflux RND transporter periplasmic adaptor subunit [Xanthomonadales bacterium]
MKTWIWALPLAAMLFLSACRQAEAPAALPRPVQVQAVTLRDAGAFDAYAGEVRAHWEADLSFRIAGKLIARPVDIGSQVKRDQVIARLDPEDLGLRRRASAAALAAARADAATASAERDRYRELLAQKLVGQSLFDAKQNAWELAQARLQQAEAEDRVSRNQARYAVLRAEREGVVTAVFAEAGQVVAAGQPVLRMARPEQKEVRISVSEDRIRTVRVGMPAMVRLSSDAAAVYQGKISEVGAAADPATRTYPVRIRLEAPDERVSLGMSVMAVLGESGGQRLALVPLQAVIEREGQRQVWVVDREPLTVSPRPVTLGKFREDGAEVLEGLAEGELIVTAGVHLLQPGQKVRLLDGAGASPATAPSAPAQAD